MRRRDFIRLLASTVAAWPLAARAQERERMRRLGVLSALLEERDLGATPADVCSLTATADTFLELAINASTARMFG